GGGGRTATIASRRIWGPWSTMCAGPKARSATSPRKATSLSSSAATARSPWGPVAGCLSRYSRIGLVYIDLSPDLNLPHSTKHGALDWMGMSHMLDVEGALPELSRFGPRHPLLAPHDVYFLGVEESGLTDWERNTLRRLDLHYVTSPELAKDPEAVAA